MPTPSPSMRAASPRRRRIAGREARSSIMSIRARPATPMRPLAQEIARVLRGRAVNPRWIAGQMRHGHRGAAEIAETLDNLFAYAALTDAVDSAQFDLISTPRSATTPCASFSSPPIRRPRGTWRRVRGARRGAASGVSRRNSSGGILASLLQGGRMSARAAPQRLVSRRAAADGDRRRPARARAHLRRAADARSGAAIAGGGARLRQRHDRASRPAAICNCAASAKRLCPTCRRGLRAARPHRRGSRGRTRAQHRREPAQRRRSGGVRSRPASRRWRRGSRVDAACARCRRSSAS